MTVVLNPGRRHEHSACSRAVWLATVIALAASLFAPAVASASRVSGQSANLITNGSFEQPVVAVGGYQLFSVGQSFTGWQVVGTPGANVAPISGSFTQNGFTFPARTGKQWVDMTGTSDTNGNAGAGLAQTVKTVRGQRYQVKFSVGNVIDPGIFGATSTIKVSVNGRHILTAVNSEGSGSKSQVWKDFSVTFQATTTASTIAFFNADNFKDTSNGFDAVAVTKIS